MASARPELARAIFDTTPARGLYESDIIHKFLSRSSVRQIEAAIRWLIERRYFRKCGDPSRPLYVRDKQPVIYTNIRPLRGGQERELLTMHSNFEEKPR